ncbi:MAG: methionine--tRNA ligase [Dehalococcoidales bacterium]|nr:methionine--tRNA ligase [Dehalococcoidales bacterium]
MNTVYITTTIPYVNGRPHIGFALELVQADVLARYCRQAGYTVRFQTGTDENSLKNVLTAKEQGIETQELVDRNSVLFRQLSDSLGISIDSFVRTTEKRHREAVHFFWKQLKPEDVYTRPYAGLYCIDCEDFYLEKDLVDGTCPEHGTRPVPVGEENYFFRLSSYQDKLEEIIDSGEVRIFPETRKNEILNFIRGGLHDISISRSFDRSGGWGIPVPGDPSQVVYVWIDALVNYLSGLGYGTSSGWQEFWGDETKKIHVIGKDVWKFHAVYWPALLLSAGLPLPDDIVIHGFLTEQGRKISKSKGSAIDPVRLCKWYGPDAVRYSLLNGVSPFYDWDFTVERLEGQYTNDLANGLGNLLSRVTALCSRAGYGDYENHPVGPDSSGFLDALQNYAYDKALKIIWDEITGVNRDIDRKKPWLLLKEGKLPELRVQLTEWLDIISGIGYRLAPFLPETSSRISEILSHKPIVSAPVLFPRIKR